MSNTIIVIIEDSKGNTYSKEWSSTADKLDIIKWTVDSRSFDIQHYVDIPNIIALKIIDKEDYINQLK